MTVRPCKRLLRAVAATSASLLAACADNDEIVLQTFDQSLSLTYSCTAFQPVATSAVEFELIGEMAMTGYQHAMATGKAAEAAELPAIREEGDFVSLERAVANYFCQNPDAIDTPRPPIVRRNVQVGSVAPNFSRPLLTNGITGIEEGNERVSLAAFRGKFVVLHPVAVWCVSCRDEQEEFIQLSAELPDNVVALGFVTGARSVNGASAWLADSGGLPNYPMLYDAESRIANRYGLTYFPQVLVIAPDGKVAYRHIGGGGIEKLPDVLAQLGVSTTLPQPAS